MTTAVAIRESWKKAMLDFILNVSSIGTYLTYFNDRSLLT